MSLNLSQRFFQHQKKTAMLAAAVLALIGALIALCNRAASPAPLKDALYGKKPLYDITQAVEDKSIWMFKSENRLAEQEKTQTLLLKEIESLKSALAKYEAQTQQNALSTFSHPQSESSEPQTQPRNAAPNAQPSPYFTGAALTNNLSDFNHDSSEREREPALPPTATIFSDTLPLTAAARRKSTPHIEHYIPAGSYAKAVLLSGVDVSAGVSSQATPKPVLLRLVHPGSLPNKAVGKMKDCRIIAAAYGDLSSERAYLRLEKLSCTEPDGHVIEHNVDGYISGEDGKNGIRGRVVMRDTEVLQRGFMGGLLSGLGKAVGKSFSATSVSPFGAVKTSNAKGTDFLAEAGAEGAGDAFELMAKYNIQRAEQYQPVIQISAGRIVDVVFHSGSPFGEQKPKTELPTTPSYQQP